MIYRIRRIIGMYGRTTIPYPIRKALDIRPFDVLTYEGTSKGDVLIRVSRQREDDSDYEDAITIYDIADSLTKKERAALVSYLTEI